jgi:hypothetical protein
VEILLPAGNWRFGLNSRRIDAFEEKLLTIPLKLKKAVLMVTLEVATSAEKGSEYP